MELLKTKQYEVGQAAADHLDYRGYSLDFFEDPMGKQLYTILDGARLDFGSDNTLYKDDVQNLIDMKLDTISDFSSSDRFTGARLTWFDNGGFRDIKLVHWGRVLKVFLIADKSQVNLDALIKESESILNKLIKIE